MAEKKISKLELDMGDKSGRALWEALGEIEREEPSAGLRRSFHDRLENASRGNWLDKLRATLGLRSNSGWLTATACVLVGIGIGNFSNEVDDSDSASPALHSPLYGKPHSGRCGFKKAKAASGSAGTRW